MYCAQHNLELQGISFGHVCHAWTAYSSLVKTKNSRGEEKELCRNKTGGEGEDSPPRYATSRAEGRRTQQ
jgi:hypothetical protein